MGTRLVPPHRRLRLRHRGGARRYGFVRRPALFDRHVQQRRQLVPRPRVEVHEHGAVLPLGLHGSASHDRRLKRLFPLEEGDGLSRQNPTFF